MDIDCHIGYWRVGDWRVHAATIYIMYINRITSTPRNMVYNSERNEQIHHKEKSSWVCAGIGYRCLRAGDMGALH
jgi:hypothetical protein